MARRADISKSKLSHLEAGKDNPSLETLWAPCVALDIPYSQLLDPPRPHIQAIRADEGAAVADEQRVILIRRAALGER